MKNVIIDTDPGKDDFLAILMLILSRQVNIQALTTVMGNSNLTDTTSNAKYLLEITNSNIPLYAGADQPLKRPFCSGQVMGKTGLSGIKVKSILARVGQATPKINQICSNMPTTILALGPLTNIARALLANPTLESKIDQIVLMGGAISCGGNTNNYAEFNINRDPDAASIVFGTRIPKVMIPLDLCYQVPLYLSDFKRITKQPYKNIILKIMRPYIKALQKYENQQGAIIYDALATYYLINPQAFTLTPMNISIEANRIDLLGQTVVNKYQKPNVLVATKIDIPTFTTDFISIINEG